jgi:hypothetical protein
MAANLYARSIFGEDALANVSIEKPIHLGPDAPVTGHIRIRAKSQVRVAESALIIKPLQSMPSRRGFVLLQQVWRNANVLHLSSSLLL